MKNNTPIKEIAIVVILVVVLFILLNPLPLVDANDDAR
jgi:hypothetical protein